MTNSSEFSGKKKLVMWYDRVPGRPYPRMDGPNTTWVGTYLKGEEEYQLILKLTNNSQGVQW